MLLARRKESDGNCLDCIRSWAPKVPMCQTIRGLGGLLSYWDEPKLSFTSFISLYDKGTSWDFLILFTFFFRSRVGKVDIDAQYSVSAGNKGLVRQDESAQARRAFSLTRLSGLAQGSSGIFEVETASTGYHWYRIALLRAFAYHTIEVHPVLLVGPIAGLSYRAISCRRTLIRHSSIPSTDLVFCSSIFSFSPSDCRILAGGHPSSSDFHVFCSSIVAFSPSRVPHINRSSPLLHLAQYLRKCRPSLLQKVVVWVHDNQVHSLRPPSRYL